MVVSRIFSVKQHKHRIKSLYNIWNQKCWNPPIITYAECVVFFYLLLLWTFSILSLNYFNAKLKIYKNFLWNNVVVFTGELFWFVFNISLFFYSLILYITLEFRQIATKKWKEVSEVTTSTFFEQYTLTHLQFGIL